MEEKDNILNRYRTGIWLDNQISILFDQYYVKDRQEIELVALPEEVFDHMKAIGHG